MNLDTHILVFHLRDETTPAENRLIESHAIGISAIVLWELAMLIDRKRVALDWSSPSLTAALRTVQIWPIDLAVARATTALDFRSDPADQIIAATSIVHAAPLVTRDTRLRASKIVPLAR